MTKQGRTAPLMLVINALVKAEYWANLLILGSIISKIDVKPENLFNNFQFSCDTIHPNKLNLFPY